MTQAAADEVWRELLSRGRIVVDATHSASQLGGVLALSLGSLGVVGALVLVVLGLVIAEAALLAVGAIVAVAAAVALVLGFALRRASRRPGGPRWVVDARGITVDGVGPVPWIDLEPSTYRMEPAARSDGYERTLVMPLTPAGAQRALALAPASRRVLNEGVRDTLLTGPQPVTSIRIPTLVVMSAGQFAAFLDAARAHFTRR